MLLNGKRLALTPKEYRLLQVLAQHAGNVVTHQHLLKEVWGSVHVHDTHYLRIFVRKLRQKIEPNPDAPRILVTELGVGYRLAQGGEGDNGARRQHRGGARRPLLKPPAHSPNSFSAFLPATRLATSGLSALTRARHPAMSPILCG